MACHRTVMLQTPLSLKEREGIFLHKRNTGRAMVELHGNCLLKQFEHLYLLFTCQRHRALNSFIIETSRAQLPAWMGTHLVTLGELCKLSGH